ncbi:MAG: Phosphatidate cytidylyltransferase [Alphaproteobacteria bacterium MarineAlpha1_Bin1]|nr:MAG: Phosphatidate cytidylyltransferase [Alphaproteobacteria bacterium MarineAlpha1_Bin1]
MNSIGANDVMAPPAADLIAPSLKTRVISAAVLLPIVVAFLYVGGLGFALFLAFAAVLMAGEWDRLTGGRGFGQQGVMLAAGLVLVLTLGYLGKVEWALMVLLPIGVVLALLGQFWGRGMVWPVLGLFWLGLPCLALMWLRMGDQGMLAVLWLFVSVWSCDTGAYISGRSIGGPKLAPRISPNKTWAGLLGGILAAMVASVLLALISGSGSTVLFAIQGALLALISQCGDLAESSLKRRFDVKDSGNLIPGHGGILDRVDGVLFAAPALVLFFMIH